MSKQFELPAANDGQVSTQDHDTVANAMFACAFEGTLPTSPGSSNQTENTLPSVLGNTALNHVGNLNRKGSTDGGTVERVMNSLGGLLRSGAPEGSLPQVIGTIGSTLGNLLPDVSIIGNVIPFDRNRRAENGSPSHPAGDILPSVVAPRRPENGPVPPTENGTRTKPIDNGNGSRPPIGLPPVHTRPVGEGNENGSRPPIDTPPVRTRPIENGSGNESRPPIDAPPVRTKPIENGSGNGSRPPIDTPPVRTPIENGGRGNEVRPLPEIDRSPKFRFPKDTPMDPKESAELAEKAAKLIKDGLANGGELSRADRERLSEALQYGINHGEQGLKDMVALINKQLEGTGLELKTDGKAHAYYQTCFPDRRGDYHGDFVYFNIAQGDKNVEWAQVKVGPGDFDRDRW